MKKILTLTILALLAFAVTAQAGTWNYSDNLAYWDFYDGTEFLSGKSSLDVHPTDLAANGDVNGIPDLLGGNVVTNGRVLETMDLYYSTNGHDLASSRFYRNTWYNELEFGDMFIDVDTYVETEGDWDYVVTNDGVLYDLSGVDAAYSDEIYVKTPDAWDGSGTPRMHHPVYASDGLLAAATEIGTLALSGWQTDLDETYNGITAARAWWDFTTIVDFDLLLGRFYTIGLATNCANDVLLITGQTTPLGAPPVPEPSTFVLLFAGLAGIVGYTVRKNRKKV